MVVAESVCVCVCVRVSLTLSPILAPSSEFPGGESLERGRDRGYGRTELRASLFDMRLPRLLELLARWLGGGIDMRWRSTLVSPPPEAVSVAPSSFSILPGCHDAGRMPPEVVGLCAPSGGKAPFLGSRSDDLSQSCLSLKT